MSITKNNHILDILNDKTFKLKKRISLFDVSYSFKDYYHMIKEFIISQHSLYTFYDDTILSTIFIPEYYFVCNKKAYSVCHEKFNPIDYLNNQNFLFFTTKEQMIFYYYKNYNTLINESDIHSY